MRRRRHPALAMPALRFPALVLLAVALAAPSAAQADFARACVTSMAVAADPAAPRLDRAAAEVACACAARRAVLPETGVGGAALDAYGARLAAGVPVDPSALSEAEQEAGLAASLALVACALDAGLGRFAQAPSGAPVPGPDRWTIAPAPPATAGTAAERLEAVAGSVPVVVEIGVAVSAEAAPDDAEAPARDPLAIRTGNGTGPVYTRQDSKGATVYVVKANQ